MQFLDFIKKYKALISVIIIIIVVIFAIFSITYFKTLNSSQQTGSNFAVGSDLKGYDALKQSIDAVSNNSQVLADGNYGKLLNQFGIIGDKSASSKSRYAALIAAQTETTYIYTDTHNAKFSDINKNLDYVAKANFPQYYKSQSFILHCQDSGCQDTPQPPEILNIIDEIKASSVADYAKQTAIDNLTNVGYISSKNDMESRIYSYITMSGLIREDGEFVKSGVGVKFSNEIDDYLLANYPDVVNKVLGEKNTQASKAYLEK